MLTIGLTGTIGSGKSAALAAFGRRGFGTVQTDALAREELSCPEVLEKLVARWGQRVMGEGAEPDRAVIAGIVFADSGELRWLEEVLHPRVRKAWQARVAADPGHPWVVEIPLLFEKRLESAFDFTVSVDCSLNVRLARLGKRGLTEEQARRRMERQWPAEKKNAAADFILTNRSTLEFLDAQVALLIRERFPPPLRPTTDRH